MNYKLNEKVSRVEDSLSVGNGIHSVGSGVTDRFKEIWAINFKGDSTSSYYADLAEKYSIDPSVQPRIGTVIEVSSGEYDCEICESESSMCVIGIVSEKPGYVMNEGLKDSVVVGLVGTVPVRVLGAVNKKDVLIPAGYGCLKRATNAYENTFKVAVALESNDDVGEKLVKCFVK